MKKTGAQRLEEIRSTAASLRVTLKAGDPDDGEWSNRMVSELVGHVEWLLNHVSILEIRNEAMKSSVRKAEESPFGITNSAFRKETEELRARVSELESAMAKLSAAIGGAAK